MSCAGAPDRHLVLPGLRAQGTGHRGIAGRARRRLDFAHLCRIRRFRFWLDGADRAPAGHLGRGCNRARERSQRSADRRSRRSGRAVDRRSPARRASTGRAGWPRSCCSACSIFGSLRLCGNSNGCPAARGLCSMTPWPACMQRLYCSPPDGSIFISPFFYGLSQVLRFPPADSGSFAHGGDSRRRVPHPRQGSCRSRTAHMPASAKWMRRS